MTNRSNGLACLIVGGVLALPGCSDRGVPPTLTINAPETDSSEIRIQPPGDLVQIAQHGEPQFEKELLDAAANYMSWGRIDDESRWAPESCNSFGAAGYGQPRFSDSSEAESHGQKLYSLFARDRRKYLSATPVTSSSVGQVIVKQSWIPEQVSDSHEPGTVDSIDHKKIIETRLSSATKGEPSDEHKDRFYPYARKDGKVFKAAKQADLFIMLKLDPATPNTDAGWVYGTVTPDSKTVTSSGKVESCMKCHVEAHGDRLFGLAEYRQIAALVELDRLGCRFTLHFEGDNPEDPLTYYVFKDKEQNRVEDRHLVLLDQVTDLKQLWLDYSLVTDAGMDHLTKLSRLRELGLSHTQLGDAGLAKLAGLRGLQRLDLRATAVTDAGLECLSGLSSLREIRLAATRATNAGIAELQRTMPELKIVK